MIPQVRTTGGSERSARRIGACAERHLDDDGDGRLDARELGLPASPGLHGGCTAERLARRVATLPPAEAEALARAVQWAGRRLRVAEALDKVNGALLEGAGIASFVLLPPEARAARWVGLAVAAVVVPLGEVLLGAWQDAERAHLRRLLRARVGDPTRP